MKLSCALVACNENTHYLDFWPAVKQAWWSIVGIPVLMVYVGDQLPEHLQNDPAVKHFKPILGWPTATQAQCIRLLYPALLQCDGAVVISDMDILPLQKPFFKEGFAQFQEHQFVSLRGIDEHEKQIYMCYVGATPKVWGELFTIQSEQDIRATLQDWAVKYAADGSHGGKGWCTDQIELYNRVKIWQEMWPDKVGLVPWTQQIPRLDRGNPQEWWNWTEELEGNIKKGVYVDFHMPPYEPFQSLIHRVVETAAPQDVSS
jgi:hypothetical protein